MGKKKQETKVQEKAAKKIKNWFGEKVDPDQCPICTRHSDCFGNIEGRCTALKKSEIQDCVFYKPLKVAVAESKAIYKKLKENERIDLIFKYGDFLSVVGAFDDEIIEMASVTEEMNRYGNQNYKKQLSEYGLEDNGIGHNDHSENPLD